MNKGPDAYRTIGEASKEVGVEPYVLRFWETKFSQLRPVKRSGGRRFYRPSDIDKLKVIKSLLYDNGLTIKGAVEQLKKINTNEGLTNKEIIIQTKAIGNASIPTDENGRVWIYYGEPSSSSQARQTSPKTSEIQ